MEKLKSSLTKTLKDLGSSFSEDVNMDDMTDFVPSPYEGASSSCGQESSAELAEKIPVRNVKNSAPVSDDDIIDSIDAAYFIEDDFDAIDYELKKLAGIDLVLEDVVRERLRLKSQLQVVSRRISTLIMEKSPSYGSQLDDMDSIRDSLKDLVVLVRTIRRALAGAHYKSRNALSILANEKKKRMLKSLMYTLRIIKTLYETEFHLKDSIEDGNFPLAIRICLEAKEAANTYRHFCCVSDLMTKLVGTTNLIENALDNALASHTVVFDQDRYASVYSAYIMLNKAELASKKLIGHFVTTLRKSARKIVEEKCGGCHDSRKNLSDFTFEHLCERISREQVVPTVRELGYVMCKILCIYHYILRFHTEDDEQRRMSNNGEDSMLGVVANHMASSMHSVFRVALMQMNSLLCCQDFSALKFDQLLDIVDMTNRFRCFGRTYFSHASNELNASLEKQAGSYFTRYHAERMEELRMFLENECFTICPVSPQFTIFDLQDFSFLEELRKQKADSTASTSDTAEQNGFKPIPAQFVNPFASTELESKRQSQRNSRSTDDRDDPHEEGNCSEEEEIEAAPNLCNTALTLLRFFGRYMRMTSLLSSIAEHSVPALTQLFEYFFYSICLFFGSDGSDNMETSLRIKYVLEDIELRLLGNGNDHAVDLGRLTTPTPCSGLNLSHVDELFGAVERVVGVESLEFVARQLDLVRPVMESLTCPTDESTLRQLDEFYAKIVSVVPETRLMVFDCVASRALKLPVLIAAVSNTKWDINELQTQHSNYVDFLVKDFEAFALRLDHIAGCFNLSESIRIFLWDRTIYYTFKALVQGYCEGGKCSTEGRALMQLDFQHLLLKLEPLCNLHPVPHTAFVDGYIKAFYLPENGLEEWITKHSEYTAKQMISLLGVATHVSKKARTRIINALND
ncbi:unnamed protein product [Cylicocyclus nassatus]|uniref:Coiled-coil domain-containing protein 132 n=1 Tax=Cylicocyclus nassatus TaxID=53992 RepID=A0AA36GYF3_CYLNA|nr:unnamed protein product [Cylicocyclus nassatus]